MSPQRSWLDLVYARLSTHQSNRPGVGLGLTVRFGLQSHSFWQYNLIKRTIRIGIKEAELVFFLNDAIMPDEDWLYDEPILPTHEILIEVQKLISIASSKNRDQSSSLNSRLISANSTLSSEIDLNLEQLSNSSVHSGQNEKSDQTRTEKFQSLFFAVKASGGQDNPRWLVRSPPGMEVLIGALIKTEHFARAQPIGNAPRISLQLRIPPHAILIQNSNGAFDSINKKLIAYHKIKRELTKEPLVLNELSLDFDNLQ